MPSTYTTNLGLEKPAVGEQSGTWGGTLNTNLDLMDEAINGIVTVTLAAAGTSGAPNTLAITDGASSNGRNAFIEFDDGGDLGADVYVQLTPNDAEKIVVVKNSLTTQQLILFQGTWDAARDYPVPNGLTAVVRFDGGGASAAYCLPVFENTRMEGTLTVAGAISCTNLSGTNTGDEVAATTTVAGVIELATQTETDTGTDATRAVTPSTLANYAGIQTTTQTSQGVIELATQAETDAGTDATRAVTPSTLANYAGLGSASSPLTTKGDLWGFDTGDNRLPVGTNDYVLTADSTTALGVAWKAAAAGGLSNVVEDTTPQLGGTLDSNNFDIELKNTGTVKGVNFYEPSAGGTSYVRIAAPALSATWTFTLPVDAGSSGYVLKTNGSGAAYWEAETAGQTPAILSDGATPSLNTGITATEVRTLIGAGTGDGDITGVTAGLGIDGGGSSGSVTITLEASSSINMGGVELATDSEANAGTASGSEGPLVVTPANLQAYTGASTITTTGDIGAIMDADFSTNGIMVRRTGPTYASVTVAIDTSVGRGGVAVADGDGSASTIKVYLDYTLSTAAPSGTPARGHLWFRY